VCFSACSCAYVCMRMYAALSNPAAAQPHIHAHARAIVCWQPCACSPPPQFKQLPRAIPWYAQHTNATYTGAKHDTQPAGLDCAPAHQRVPNGARVAASTSMLAWLPAQARSRGCQHKHACVAASTSTLAWLPAQARSRGCQHKHARVAASTSTLAWLPAQVRSHGCQHKLGCARAAAGLRE